MVRKLKNIISITVVLALSINFVLYSSQSYSPPRAESISYSIVNCPSHEGQHHAQKIVQIITGSESESGSEKDCFCYDCCTQRVSSYISTSEITQTLARYFYYTFEHNENLHKEDSYKNLPIRSPPAVLT